MFSLLLRLIAGFAAGSVSCFFLPVRLPFHFPEFIMGLALFPGRSFLGMFFFTVSFLLHASLLKEAVMNAWKLLKKEGNIVHSIVSFCVILNFSLLAQIGIWQTAGLACFSAVYGLTSYFLHRQQLKRAH
ncbi:hypothetical protein [Metabacillus indicus]|uniref:hypothetical protein n=1 Tax=Metabacillus indicus TaxID=246786 RepID=UPI0004939A7D|nr:hypothetical protein [Metabacillus indicus]KEZ50750.1 hypothetical protein AZ46_0208865 [Metabacillus indicus LMG 22858]